MVTNRGQKRKNHDELGHAHELTFSCYHRFRFLQSDRVCEWFAEAIDIARSELNFSVWAYVFMPEHVHMVVFPKCADTKISEIRGRIKQPVSRKAVSYLRRNHPDWLERIAEKRKRRTEYHFWLPGGGYDRNIVEPATLSRMIEYIHLNPLRRGLVDRTVDWKWSSAGWLAELKPNCLRPDPIPWEWANF